MDKATQFGVDSLLHWPFQASFREYRAMLGIEPGDAFIAWGERCSEYLRCAVEAMPPM